MPENVMSVETRLYRLYRSGVYPSVKSFRGATRVKEELRKRIEFDKEILLNVEDVGIIAPSQNYQARNIFLKEKPSELNQLEYILTRIKEEDKFVDVGACYGLFANVVSEKTGAEVHCFEPFEFNQSFLYRNKEEYSRDYTIHGKSCLNENGVVKMQLGQESTGRNQVNGGENGVEVQSCRIGDVLDDVDYLKLDVEGAELEALKGAEELLEKDKPEIILELHKNELQEEFGSSKKEVIEFLEDKGYRLYVLEGSSLKHFTKSSGNQDVVARTGRTIKDDRDLMRSLQSRFGSSKEYSDSGAVMEGAECPECGGVLLVKSGIGECMECGNIEE